MATVGERRAFTEVFGLIIKRWNFRWQPLATSAYKNIYILLFYIFQLISQQWYLTKCFQSGEFALSPCQLYVADSSCSLSLNIGRPSPLASGGQHALYLSRSWAFLSSDWVTNSSEQLADGWLQFRSAVKFQCVRVWCLHESPSAPTECFIIINFVCFIYQPDSGAGYRVCILAVNPSHLPDSIVFSCCILIVRSHDWIDLYWWQCYQFVKFCSPLVQRYVYHVQQLGNIHVGPLIPLHSVVYHDATPKGESCCPNMCSN